MRLALAAAAALAPIQAEAAEITIIYTPRSVIDLRGHVEVADFGYIPARPGIEPNQIPNTALGSIRLSEPLGTFIGNAVRQELRTSGVSLQPGAPCRLTGEISHVRIEDLGFDADFNLSVRYRLTRADGTDVHATERATHFVATKVAGAASIALLFAQNINGILSSPDFVQRFEQECPNRGNAQ